MIVNLIYCVILFSLLETFGDSEEGRLRLYQTADVVILYTNGPMATTWGVCGQYVHAPDDTQASYRAIIMAASYCKAFIYSSLELISSEFYP